MKRSLVQKAKLLSVSLLSMTLLSACMHQEKIEQKVIQSEKCQVNVDIERNKIPQTPHNMSLPAFGQGVIGWATGPEGAKQRFENIKKEDLVKIQNEGTTLEMVNEWQAFYENEVKRNPCNPTAPYRAALMQKIAELWVE